MSRPSTCYSCQLGKHDKHNLNFGIKPGLIGGEHCACEGDCAEQFAAASAEIAKLLGWKP